MPVFFCNIANYIRSNKTNKQYIIMNHNFLFSVILLLTPFFVLAQVDESKPIKVSKAAYYAKTAPLSELAVKVKPDKSDAIPVEKEVFNKLDVDKFADADKDARPGKVQMDMGTRQSRGPLVGFAGQGNTGSYPPDTDGDVSATHFVQMVNSRYNVYLKDGTKVLGPLNLSTLWASLPGGPWGNSGDPIVLYDEEADRWILTQFAPRNNYTQNYELFAVSETNDPTGAYHLYAFEFGNQFNDYPKLGVWSDGYYATYNMFASSGGNLSHIGAKITAAEREKMLIGDPDAAMIEFFKSGYYSTMPADIDGETLPDEGTPCPVMYITNSGQIEMWSFASNWDNTGSSTLTKQSPNLIPSSFSETPGNFIKQPNTSVRLDALGAMIMNRLAYRKFDTHESLLTNHSILVQPDGGGAYNRSGVRWYEFRRTTDDWEIYQEGTFAPNDGVNRWMGSIAMNANGDIGLGYSVSNEDVYPSIRYTGRHDGDPLGEMTIQEVELKGGTSSQTSFERWGDYSCLNVDPENDTVFWFTTEYNGWSTWIASFDLGGVSGATADAGDDAYICVNDQYETQGNGTAVFEVEWTTDGDGFFSPSNQFNSTYIRGSQDVANGGCTLTMTVTGYDGEQVSDDMYLNIVPWVNAGEDATILDTEAYQLEAQGTDYGTIVWVTSGDGTFSDENILNPIYTPGPEDLVNGQATLTIEVAITEPCEDDDADAMTLYISGVGIDEINNRNNLEVYPNPTNGVFTINVNGLTAGEELTYFVYTSHGKEVWRELATAKSNTYERVIDLSDFKAGIYFVNIQTENGNITKKVIKE
jgi:hypothetical protein